MLTLLVSKPVCRATSGHSEVRHHLFKSQFITKSKQNIFKLAERKREKSAVNYLKQR